MVPDGWEVEVAGNGTLVRGHFICPHCARAATFSPVAQYAEQLRMFALLKCNYVKCGKVSYVQFNRHSVVVELFPTRPVVPPHSAIPPAVAQDWIEAQKAASAGCPKATAVMCRRVLYGVLLDQGCKEHPFHEGLKQLFEKRKLPEVMEQQASEIKEDGHDAAHPFRTLSVSDENVMQTLAYTEELLRFVFVEPAELAERLAKKKSVQ